jgi:hypothetical protein
MSYRKLRAYDRISSPAASSDNTTLAGTELAAVTAAVTAAATAVVTAEEGSAVVARVAVARVVRVARGFAPLKNA